MSRRLKTTLVWFLIWLAMMAIAGGLFYFYFQPSWPILILATINLATFCLFGWDKLAAGQKIDRVPEMVLYSTIICGGGVGALLGMNFFRHKTRKSLFQLIVFLIFMIQFGLLAFLFSKEILSVHSGLFF